MTCAFLYEVCLGRQFLRALVHPTSLASKTPTTFASQYLLRDIDRANSLEKQDKWLLPEEMLNTLTVLNSVYAWGPSHLIQFTVDAGIPLGYLQGKCM